MHARLSEVIIIIRLVRGPVGEAHYGHCITVGVRFPDPWRLSTLSVYALSSRPETGSNVF